MFAASKIKSTLCLILTLLFGVLLMGSFAIAEEDTMGDNHMNKFPSAMAYEGYVTNENGEPLTDGEYTFHFALYANQQGGNPIWTEEHQSVEVHKGYIQLYLGRGTNPQPLDLPFDKPYYLGIRLGENEELSPRMELTPAGYSFRSKTAESVSDAAITTAKIADGAVTDDKIQNVSWTKITGIPTAGGASVSGAAEMRWMLNGNAKTKPPIHFMGTTDANDVVFKTVNQERLKLTTDGKVVVDDDIYMDDDNVIGIDDSSERIIFDEDNNDVEIMGADVGIGGGAAEPEAKLHVYGSGEIGRNHIALFENSGNEQGMAVTSAQDVGIGTEEPLCKLHVKAKGEYGGHIALFENTESGSGIAIKVNAGTPNNVNNFLTFQNSGGGAVGRIEGQDMADLFSSWEFIWNTIMFVVDETLILAGADASSAEEPSDEKEADAAIANGAALFAHYLEWIISSIKNIGVYFGSGAGDYAECLEKMNQNENFEPGDIVGIYGGKITKETSHAEQLMVVSLAPIVLGNMPPETDAHRYEKVAFLGQIPVKVIGSVKQGDYIIPSGLKDGSGIAVEPEMMTAEEYAKVVGRAWGYNENSCVKLVNMAIGLQSGDMARFVHQQAKELKNVRSELTFMQDEMSAMKEIIKEASLQNMKNESPVTKVSQQ